MLKRSADFLQKHASWVAFILVTACLLYSNLSRAPFPFYYDSLDYWNLAYSFHGSRGFSLLAYDDPIRGYLFPFVLYLVRRPALFLGLPEALVYEIVASVACGAFLALGVPAFVKQVFGRKVTLASNLVFSGLAILFWRGSFAYPLTDFPAFAFLGLGILSFWKWRDRWYGSLLSGLLVGGAAILRPVYQIVIPFWIAWLVYSLARTMRLRFPALLGRLALVLAGLAVVFAPQAVINSRVSGKFTPFSQSRVDSGNLYQAQLSWGINTQKYETNIGSAYPSAQVVFTDPLGQHILVQAGYLPEDSAPAWVDPPLTPDQYFRLVIGHPIEFIGVYAGHLFNGLDVTYDTPYVQDVSARSGVLQFINYSLWFIVLAGAVSWRRAGGRWHSGQFLLFLFALPALLSIPTAVEVRFMLPLQFLAYAAAAFWALPSFFALEKREKAAFLRGHVVWYLAFLAFCFIRSLNVFLLVR